MKRTNGYWECLPLSAQILFHFSIIIPGHYETEFVEKTIDDLNKLLELRCLELHVNEVRKRGNTIKIGDKEYKLSDFDNQKYEILGELKNVKYNDL